MTRRAIRTNMTIDARRALSFPIWVLVVGLAVALFFLLFYFDNIYANKVDPSQAQYSDGKLIITDKELLERATPLDEWEYFANCSTYVDYCFRYDGKIVNVNDDSTYLNKDKAQTCTYALSIVNETKTRSNLAITLYLPPVNSACWLFVNGEYVQGSGDVGSNYKPYAIGQQINLTLEYKERVEIVVIAENRSSFEGGITTPPMIGKNGKVVGMNNIKTILRLSTILYTAFLSAIAFWVFASSKDKIFLWLGLMSLTFAVAVSDVLVANIGTGWIWAKEIILELAKTIWGLYLVLTCSTIISRSKTSLVAQYVAVGINALAVLLICFVKPFTSYLNYAIDVYKGVVMVINILYICIYALVHYIRSRKSYITILSSSVLFASIIFEIYAKDTYLPMYTLGPFEWGCLIMLILMSIRTINQMIIMSKRNLQFNENLMQEVQKRTAKIESLLKEQKEFTSMVAHDLKSPLASIKMMLSQVNAPHNDIDTMDAMINNIDLKIMDMTDNITTLQNFNALDMTDEPYQLIEVGEFLQDICDFIRPDADVEGISLQFRRRKKAVYIYAPVKKLTHAIENIIFNSITFCGEDDVIKVKYSSKIDCNQIVVSDTGCGISPQALPHIFDKFYSERSMSSSTFKGDGLGLYFVKMLVESIGGKVSANSWLKSGTDIIIDLPKAETPMTDSVNKNEQDTINTNEEPEE
ncbi:MAG: sensor histidine kinase [Christensenellales bacterium]